MDYLSGLRTGESPLHPSGNQGEKPSGVLQGVQKGNHREYSIRA